MKDIYEKRQWHSSNVNKLESSTIHSYLNSTFLNLFDSNIKDAIKQVKIPYRKNGGTGGTNQSGANGLSCKIFLLSGYEVGWTSSDDRYFPQDGAKLSYFESGTGTSANNKRIAKLNGSAAYWWLRSPHTNGTYYAWYVLTDGHYGSSSASNSCGVRPALILPSTLVVDENGVISEKTGNALVKIPQTLPSTYSPIEYLQFTGTQYIDTGAIVDSNTGFDITFEVLNGQSGSPYYNLFGVRGNDSSGGTGETQNFFRIDTIPVDSNSGTEFKYGSTVYNSGIKNTSKINIKLINKVYTKPDGSTITVAGDITSGLSMYIGCINKAGEAYGNKSSMKLDRFKIYNGSTLAHDFIPVQRISDKVLGLYDLKTSTFKTNLGSGVFTSNLMNDPSSLAYFNGDSLQSQGNLSLTITNNNATLSNEQTHFGKNSLKFDGSSSYMYMPFPSTYTGDITIEGWFYQTSNNNTNYPTPFTLISSAGRGMYMHRLSSQTFVAATPSNSWPGLGGGTTALNTWTHIAMCLSGTTTYCFLDGKLKGTLTDTNTSYVGLTLGTLAESASSNHQSGCYYKGYIAELKVSKGCKWTKDFTLPAAPYSTAKDSSPWKQPIQMFVNTGISTTIPSGLVELEYIQSSGTQYIDTGIKASKNLKVEADIDVSPASGWVMILGDYTNGSYFSWWRQNTTMYAYYGSNNKTLTELTGKRKYTSNNTNNIWSIDTSKITVTPNSSDFSKNGSNLYLFSVNNGGNYNKASMKLYSCKMYDNGTLVRDFIPAKRISDDKCGLWDKVNYKFYTDINGNNFKAGAEKTAIAAIGTPIEYIQSSGTQYIDTEFKPNQNTRLIADVEILSVPHAQLIGGRISSADAAFNMLVSSATAGRDDYNTTVLNFTAGSSHWKIDKNKNITTVNGSIVTHNVGTFTTTCSIYINAVNTNGAPMSSTTANARWYKVKIYDNGILVRDFIPIKTTTNIYGLWDKVNKVFYKNAGTGTFTGGPTITLSGWHKIKGVWAKTAANTWSQAL